MVNNALKRPASAELQMKLPEGKERGTARLREAEATATRILDLFNGREAGREDPDAYYVIGRASELRMIAEGVKKDGDQNFITAFAAYLSALPEPEKADSAKLAILLARTEFIIDPRWKHHVVGVDAYRPTRFVRYADRAVTLANDNASDATTKARAYAASALARALVNDAEPPGSEGIKERRDEAITRFKLALEFYPRDPRPWRWRYELARQLRAKMVESPNAERDKLGKQALAQLKEAFDDAPPADQEQLVAPLQKMIKAMK